MTRRRDPAAPSRNSRRAGTSAFGPAWLHRRLATLATGSEIPPSCVAFSGGVDSTALLAALAALPELRGRLRAVHVDHRLQPASAEWARHCVQVARQLGVPCVVRVARIEPAAGESLEAVARDARYALLAQELRDGEWLLTAHHEDDQAESLLLQLLRGAGIAGLAAMPESTPFARGTLVRPLLPVARAVLASWLAARGIGAIDDPSNADERFDRNYLRHRVLPVLRDRWPGAVAAIARSAGHVAEGRRLLDALARADAERAADGAALSVAALRALPPARRRNAVRWWIARAGVVVPGTGRLQQIVGPLLEAREDANPRVTWPGATVARESRRLVLHATAPPVGEGHGAATWRWRPGRPWTLPDGGSLCIRRDRHGPLDLDALPPELRVARRTGGERLRPQAGRPARTLKQLLQEARVPPRERMQLPLLFAGERLVAAGESWLDVSVQAGPSTRRRGRVHWSAPRDVTRPGVRRIDPPHRPPQRPPQRWVVGQFDSLSAKAAISSSDQT